jgi:hypothetical protein
MGLASVDHCPEHYYCEQCKPENHAALLRFVPFPAYIIPSPLPLSLLLTFLSLSFRHLSQRQSQIRSRGAGRAGTRSSRT